MTEVTSRKKNFEIPEENILLSGHYGCPGCGQALAIRYIVNTMGENTISTVPPSCAAIISGAQPLSSMRIPLYQTTLESSAASASGIRRALNRQGMSDVNVLSIAGDGGTYDIGFQSLSGAAERNEDIVYVCLDNEGYMNTGNQKSGASPHLVATATTPGGKPTAKKNLAAIMASHNIPYVGTACSSFPDDLARKVAKARDMRGEGLRFIVCLISCPTGWGVKDNEGIKIGRLAVDSGLFPLYEVDHGQWIVNRGPQGVPVREYYKLQKRYKHLTEEQIQLLQEESEAGWQMIVDQVECSARRGA